MKEMFDVQGVHLALDSNTSTSNRQGCNAFEPLWTDVQYVVKGPVLGLSLFYLSSNYTNVSLYALQHRFTFDILITVSHNIVCHCLPQCSIMQYLSRWQ